MMCVFIKSGILLCCLYLLLKFALISGRIISEGKLHTGASCFYNGHSEEESLCFTLETGALTWEGAGLSCNSRGGTLVHEDSELTHSFLQQLMRISGWQRVWLGGKKQVGDWEWVGGESLEEAEFMQWPVLPDHADRDCVKVVTYEGYVWEDASCGETHAYICETSADSELCEEASKVFYEVLESSGQCFMFSHSDVAVNWFSAKRECERFGGRLAHLSFEAIQERIEQVEPGIQSNVNGYWIGATRALWNWDYSIYRSVEPVSEFHWEESQPNRSGDCLVLERFSDQVYGWANWNCSETLNYICQYDRLLISPEEMTEKPEQTESTASTDPTAMGTTSETHVSTKFENTTKADINSVSTTQVTNDTATANTKSVTTESSLSSSTLIQTTSTRQESNVTGDITSEPKLITTSVTPNSTEPASELCHFIDLCWVIERHPHMTEAQWSDIIQFSVQSINKLQLSPTCFQISVLTYQKTVRDIISFTDSLAKTELIEKISTFPFFDTEDAVNISAALEKLQIDIFVPQGGVRDASRKLVLLIKSDSTLLTDIDLKTIDLASKLKSRGVYLAALTIGSVVERIEAENILNTLCSPPTKVFQHKVQAYSELVHVVTSDWLSSLYYHVASQPLPKSTTTTDDLDQTEVFEKTHAGAMTEENEPLVTVLLAAIVSFTILIVVVTVIIGMLLLKRKRQRQKLQSKIRVTTHSNKSVTSYEELANQSSLSGYSTGSLKSTSSHGSTRQKIARMKSKSKKSIVLENEGGITTPWGSMRRSQKRSPRSSIEYLTGASWPAD